MSEQARSLILPDDPALTRTILAGAPNKRAARARLRRAEAAGILPRRVYLSSQRFAYRADELTEALERLPRQHVEALGSQEPGASWAPVDLRSLMDADEGLPRTVVELDADGDIAIYRAEEPAWPPQGGGDRTSRLRREALSRVCRWPKSAPYCITRDRVNSPAEALHWLAHVSGKACIGERERYALANLLAGMLSDAVEDHPPT